MAGQPTELFLIDGNSLAYRAFFALPEEISTSDGRPTNTIFGFASMLVKLLTDFGQQPTIVVWDSKYHYGFWRPITAIELAGTDANPDTAVKPGGGWLPLITTPPYPDYTSGLNGIIGAGTRAMARVITCPPPPALGGAVAGSSTSNAGKRKKLISKDTTIPPTIIQPKLITGFRSHTSSDPNPAMVVNLGIILICQW